MMKKLVLVTMLVVSVLTLAGCGGRNASFGYVDMQKIYTESAKVQQLEQELNKKIKEIEEASAKEKQTLSEVDYQKKQQAHQAEFLAIQKKAETDLKSSMDAAMQEVAKEKNLGAVLIKNTVLYGGTDVTDEVLKKLK